LSLVARDAQQRNREIALPAYSLPGFRCCASLCLVKRELQPEACFCDSIPRFPQEQLGRGAQREFPDYVYDDAAPIGVTHLFKHLATFDEAQVLVW
jgi:hypothetical protein